MFRSLKQHATEPYHGKKRHGMKLLTIGTRVPFWSHEPKRNRKYDGTHVNITSYITDSNMAGTTIRRHVDELVQLTTEQNMAWQGNRQ